MDRHDMLLLTEEGQEQALWAAGIAGDAFLLGRQREYELNKGETWCIPAIFRRQEGPRGETWEVGFSFPWFRQGHRIRLSGEVRKEDVVKVFTPFDILKCPVDDLDPKWRTFLDGLRAEAGAKQIRAGIYGSAALTILSGLPYLHQASDLDMIVEAVPVSRMASFLSGVKELASGYGIQVDMEIRVDGEGDIKAQELFSRQRTMVVRGNHGIWLRDREYMEQRIDALTSEG